VPLPEDRGRRGDARPKVHRFRSYGVELGRRLRAFRKRYALTQAEAAVALGAGSKTTVTQWEIGARTPEGVLRERVEALVAGGRWPQLRAAVVAATGASTGTGGDMPRRWADTVRWYRRASRERSVRTALGPAIAAGVAALRGVHRPEDLRARYLGAAGPWGCGVLPDADPTSATPSALRRAEDAVYGLRWLELTAGLCFDLCRSLVPQLPLRLARERPREDQVVGTTVAAAPREPPGDGNDGRSGAVHQLS
jgi:DNA-binding XRE family transcriptional regulator